MKHDDKRHSTGASPANVVISFFKKRRKIRLWVGPCCETNLRIRKQQELNKTERLCRSFQRPQFQKLPHRLGERQAAPNRKCDSHLLPNRHDGGACNDGHGENGPIQTRAKSWRPAPIPSARDRAKTITKCVDASSLRVAKLYWLMS
jgi:hypothetical protein